MIWKQLMLCSTAVTALAASSQALAQQTPGLPGTVPTAPSRTQTEPGADEAPKPQTAEDQNADPASPLPSAQSAPVQDGDIVVTGLRRSIQSAQAIKRTSDGIVDAVVAEDIGKLPDTFASSALQRVSGVSVTRAAGEAAGVTVRGLPDLTTTYNGREIFTADGRFVAIQDFPAGTIAALEVYKSGTANQIEGGIAGEINVRGRRPFDFDGLEISGSANEVLFEQASKFSPNGNLLISDRWNTGIGEMGLLVNGSYTGIDFLDSTREQSVVIATTTAATAPGAKVGTRYPDAQAIYYGAGHRWRPSANAAFQWRPTPELEINVDGLFQGYRGHDANRYMFVPVFPGPPDVPFQLSNVTTRGDNPNLAQSATVTGANRPDGYFASGRAKTDTYQIGGGATWKKGGLQISGDASYTDSKNVNNNVNLDYAFATSPTRTVNFDSPGTNGGPVFDFGSFDQTDPANYISRGLFQEYVVLRGKETQARGDVQYDFNGGLLKRIEFGVRYSDRKAMRDRGAPYISNEADRLPLSALPLETGTTRPGFTFDDTFPVYRFADVNSDSVFNNIAALRTLFGAPAGLPAFQPTENFRADEKAYAAYAQVKYGFKVGTIVVDGLLGLRAVKSKDVISSFAAITAADGSVTNPLVTAKNNYTDYLPNFSARVAFTENVQLRLAYTQTRTRPNFFDLRPTLSLNSPPTSINPDDPNSGRRTGSTGNPDLTPLNSNNYDASLEWYFSRTGSLTGGIFRRDARGFLATVPVNSDDPTYGPLRIDTPVNLGKTRLQGAEIAFATFLDLDFLPTWARSFGVQANGTFIDNKGDLQPDFAATYGNKQQHFPGVSKWLYNVVALYERPEFSARLAYNYRSSFATGYSIETFDPIAHPIIERGRGQLDFSTSVTPVKNITLAFDVANLLGNPLRRYRQFDTGDTYPRNIVYLERSYSLGVRFRF